MEKTLMDHTIAHACTEAQTRIDLAALHRVCAGWGWNEAVVNHMTALVPGCQDRFLLIPYGLHWAEVCASDFLVVDLDGRVLEGSGRAETSAVALHAPLHRRLPQAACVVHTHQPNLTALTSLADQTLLMLQQDSMIFHDAIAYIDVYDSVPLGFEAGETCARALGNKIVLLMKNHGPMVVGETIAKTFQTLYYLDRAARVQMSAFASGRPLQLIADAFAAECGPMFRAHYLGEEADMHFDAVKRLLDREGCDYAASRPDQFSASST
jgi:ribulose-5-phosphate 4-epimerase/fuculose-1-phosphate aldolase